MAKRQQDTKTKWQKDKKAKRQKDRKIRDKGQSESLILWRQGSFALLRCFAVVWRKAVLKTPAKPMMAFHIKRMWQKSKAWYILSLNNPKFKGKQDWVNRLFTRGDLNFCPRWDDLQDKCFRKRWLGFPCGRLCAQSVKEGAWDTRAKQGNTTNNHCKYCDFFVFVFVSWTFGWSGSLRDSEKGKTGETKLTEAEAILVVINNIYTLL